MITVAVTGHRPERLSNIKDLEEDFKKFLIENEVYRVYQGMCEGFDLLAADVSKELGIPYVACRPWMTHMSGPSEKYSQVLKDAQEVHHINMSMMFPGAHVYHDRNHYMVDHTDVVYAAWDGFQRGGTFQTIRYARRQGKRVYRFNVEYPEHSGWLN
jgi:uncharacterized phage-like protein YoqJ